ncbi:hypothetical protein N7448_005733 [Penicillium atrosanguineum]|uniref:uncharacterized protein n=1 Tax=Penicillium atrosanguineum TaxID=1132637 RepID=UPI002395B5FC|nr:uncharacterized protein N7443_009471 [Penicillium atrosanguineum]KAJ5126431.1 hypothetical protein N7526_008608 [Penicillium atrosanguineum]KAJ5137179.1 hypothetical protein N7448_005733 [Penicillium atrosanguineum]KAJ5293518.1 hypothetical protein N7443_009471 [Penicillium atrosanguineum]
MPRLVHHVSGADWAAIGPKSPTQQFFKNYVETVDANGFNSGSGTRFYAKDAIFHNQNNAQYNGGDEMWAFMKQLFGRFRKMKHDFINVFEIENDDGTMQLISQNVRNIWMLDNETDQPSVSIPMSWICRIGPADEMGTANGLQYKEVWLYWDTALLAPFLPQDAVAFQAKNILEKGDASVV